MIISDNHWNVIEFLLLTVFKYNFIAKHIINYRDGAVKADKHRFTLKLNLYNY